MEVTLHHIRFAESHSTCVYLVFEQKAEQSGPLIDPHASFLKM